MAKAVIILGARWAGLPLAHKLLKYTLPKAKDGLKVFLVMPNTQFCWGVIPGAIPDSQLFLPIEPGFAQYSVSNFEFVLGKASRLDPDRKTIEVALNDRTRRLLSYDYLVIATGSQIRSNLPCKLVGTQEERSRLCTLFRRRLTSQSPSWLAAPDRLA